MSVQALYHVPRSQVWPGSRGRQVGHVHLHIDGRALCGRDGWYEREGQYGEIRCQRCVLKADKLGVAWPDPPAYNTESTAK